MKATIAPQPTPDRPLTVMDVVDGSFNILRVRPKTVAAIVAVFTLPIQLLGAWLARNTFAAYANLDFDSFDPDTGTFEGQPGLGDTLFTLDWAISLLMLPFIGVALTHLVHGWTQGIDRGPMACIVFALRKAPVILASFVLVKIAATITLFLTLPLFIMLAPVIAVEEVGPITAIKRAVSLARRRSGPVYGLYISVVVVSGILLSALGTVPSVAAWLLGTWGWVALFALGMVSEAVATILGVGAAVLVYFDTLRRTEGADIQRQIDEIAAAHAR